MSSRLPIVLDDCGQLQRLQSTDELDTVPTEDDFERLEKKFNRLVFYLLHNGIELPPDLVVEAKE